MTFGFQEGPGRPFCVKLILALYYVATVFVPLFLSLCNGLLWHSSLWLQDSANLHTLMWLDHQWQKPVGHVLTYCPGIRFVWRNTHTFGWKVAAVLTPAHQWQQFIQKCENQVMCDAGDTADLSSVNVYKSTTDIAGDRSGVVRSTVVSYLSNPLSTQMTQELLYVTVSVVLGSSLLTLIAVMFVCACRHRQRQRVLGKDLFYFCIQTLFIYCFCQWFPLLYFLHIIVVIPSLS